MRIALLVSMMLMCSLARAQPTCGRGPEVELKAVGKPSAAEVAAQLAAGLAGSGIHVCTARSAKPLAHIELDAGAGAARIRVTDAVTHKQLERSLDLSAIPVDGRAVALALYAEELLLASWAELTLETRAPTLELPVEAPPEVRRVVARALPAAQLRLSLGGGIARFRSGLRQAGPTLTIGYALRAGLELSARLGHRASPRTRAQLGSVDTRAFSVGAALTPSFRVTRALRVLLPQAISFYSVTFLARAEGDALADSGRRTALVFSHALGLRAQLAQRFSISASAALCWTGLSAEASEDGRATVGMRGVGGEGEVSLDAHF